MLDKFISFILSNWIFLLVVIIAAILRFSGITHTPPSLNWDEVSHGYNAYSILETGKDEWGETLPLIFRAYGDYKLPVYIYTTVISVALFGLNAFAVRLPSVLAGIGIVIFTYFLTLELFKNNKHQVSSTPVPFGRGQVKCQALGTVAALLVAIEPWGLFLSRGAFEANFALFLFISGIYFFLKGNQRPIYYIPSTIFLGLTVWTYNSYRIFTPLMIVVLVFVYRNEIKNIYKKSQVTIYLSLITSLVFLAPMFYQLASPAGLARYGWVGIIDEGAEARIIEQRNASGFSPFISRLIYNKGTYFTQEFAKNYFSHFNPRYLFFEGGSHYQFSVPGKGLLYPINLLFFYAGLTLLIYSLLKSGRGNADRRVWQLLFALLILAPIPSSLTTNSPHVLRSITFLPAPMIVTASGLIFVSGFIRKKKMEIGNLNLQISLRLLIVFLYLSIVTWSVSNYLGYYFGNYRNDYSWSWQYGYKEAVDYAMGVYDDYDKIIVTKKYGEPHAFFLFNWSWDPESYRNDSNLIRFYQSNWYWVDGFDKFYFVNDWNIAMSSEQETINNEGAEFVLESGEVVSCQKPVVDCLLITSPGNAPEKWRVQETVYFLDGSPAFEIYDNR